MLLGRPWLRDVEVAHDWGNNIVTIQGNGMVRTIVMTKHLGVEVKQLNVLLCYNYQFMVSQMKRRISYLLQN
jgi:hypothetical protein